MTDLQNPIFTDETAAREALEAARWPNGPHCPHCGNTDQARIAKIEGTKRSHRPGLYYCNECKGQFTVTVGTVFERSKVPLSKWWLATHLLGASKKGMSAHQLHRMLGVTYKTAWFMAHRIREAMRDGSLAPMGGNGGTVEADETYYGKQENPKPSWQRRGRPYLKGGVGPSGKRAVVALVDLAGRGGAEVRVQVMGLSGRPPTPAPPHEGEGSRGWASLSPPLAGRGGARVARMERE
jgi:transposase-like protein